MAADDVIPDDVNEYKRKEYWDGRFEREDHYEWLRSFADIAPMLQKHLRPNDTVLHVGCGTSRLGVDVFDAGLARAVINADYSPVVIQRMTEKYPPREGLEWRVMDCRSTGLPDHSLDVVLDKAMMDAFVPREIYGDDPDPEVGRMVAELRRVLRPGGRYVQITFGQPHMRRRYFAPLRYRDQDPPDAQWALELETIGGMGFVQYYCYCWTRL
jgi:ubiquinone/menaquinone biosynthesis C-methylase UbiE